MSEASASVFRDSLENICRDLDGVVMATLMGIDGLPVETLVVTEPPMLDGRPLEIDALLVEYSAVLDQVRRSAEVFGAGDLQEMTIRASQLTTVFRILTQDYFVAIAIVPGAIAGKGRFLLRTRTASLIPELS